MASTFFYSERRVKGMDNDCDRDPPPGRDSPLQRSGMSIETGDLRLSPSGVQREFKGVIEIPIHCPSYGFRVFTSR